MRQLFGLEMVSDCRNSCHACPACAMGSTVINRVLRSLAWLTTPVTNGQLKDPSLFRLNYLLNPPAHATPLTPSPLNDMFFHDGKELMGSRQEGKQSYIYIPTKYM